MTDLAVNINKTIKAPIEKVFDAWLNPETLAKFILPMPGMPEPEVQNSPEPGGKFTIVMAVGDEKIPHTGEYIEINRPVKLVFSWQSPCSMDDSRVTLVFKSVDESNTLIELTHLKFIDEATRQDHEGGWGNILEALNAIMIKKLAAA